MGLVRQDVITLLPPAEWRTLPADGFAVLSVVRPRSIDSVNRQIFSYALRSERRFGHCRVPREQDPLIAADGSAVDGRTL